MQSRRWVLQGLWFTDGYLYAGSGAPCAGQRRDREPLELAPTFSVASEENLGAEPETGSGETGGETRAEIPECWGRAGLGWAAQRGGLGLGGHKLFNSRRGELWRRAANGFCRIKLKDILLKWLDCSDGTHFLLILTGKLKFHRPEGCNWRALSWTGQTEWFARLCFKRPWQTLGKLWCRGSDRLCKVE